MFAGDYFTPRDVSFPEGQGDVCAKHDIGGIQRRPDAEPRPSRRSQELMLAARGQDADYLHFEQNRNLNGESLLKKTSTWALTGRQARVI